MSHPIPPVEVIDEFVECSRYGEMEEMQRMMLEYPLLSSAVSATFNNNTALHYASANNLIPILDLLLPHYPPAMVNLPNHDGNTALHMASLMGHAEAVDRLLMHGADANLKNESGRSPATLAEQQGHHEVVATLLKSFDPPEEQDEGEDEEENHLKSSVAAAAESLEVENIDR